MGLIDITVYAGKHLNELLYHIFQKGILFIEVWLDTCIIIYKQRQLS